MTTNLPMGGFPAVDRKVGITIRGLEQWKDGIVSGATVKVEIIQDGQVIHSEVFSGKASGQFTRVVVIKATYGDLIAVHNRPDLPKLEASASFIDEALLADIKTYKLNTFITFNSEKLETLTDKIREIVSRYMTGGATEYIDELVEELKSLVEKENDSARLATIISEQIRQRLKKEMQPGGLLHGR